MGTVPAQRDAGGDPALLAEVEMHIVVSCPALPLTSLPKSERKVDSALCLAQTGQCGTQGHKYEPVWGHLLLVSRGRAGLAPEPVAVRAAQSYPGNSSGSEGHIVTYVTSKGKC